MDNFITKVVDFVRGQIICKLEKGRIMNNVAEVICIAHCTVPYEWKTFRRTGTSVRKIGSDPSRESTPKEEQCITLQDKINRPRTCRKYCKVSANGHSIMVHCRPDVYVKVGYFSDNQIICS